MTSAAPAARNAPCARGSSSNARSRASGESAGAKTRMQRSAPREVALALLDIGRETFLRVLALEQQLLQLALDRERGLERDLGARLYRALDPAHGARRLVRRAELLGVGLHLAHELRGVGRVPDLIHETQLLAAL